ncbi:C2 calcium-dependent domain-containing protein 4C-like isoform X1 [Mustelus asterias]
MWFLERAGGEGESGKGRRAHPNVLTPDRIPEFVIPPSLQSGRRDVRRASPRGGGGLAMSARHHVVQVEADSEGEEGALCVPRHANPPEILRLPESPHTRRKESLFHARIGDWAQSLRPRPDLNTPPSFSSSSSSSSSADSTPFGSPRAARSPLPGSKGKGQTPPALSPSADGRGLPGRPSGADRPASSWLAPPPAPLYPPDLARPPQRPPKENTVALNKGGALRLWAEYTAEGGRLRVRLVSGEGLYPASFPPGAVNCCASFYLLPGKTQKQRSAVIRRSRNPIFNEDFYFEGLAPDDLASKALRVKVVNKGVGMRRDCIMGKTKLGLAAILPGLLTLNRG